MSYTNKKVTGIWIDTVEANLISTADKSNKGAYAIAEKIINIQRDDHTLSEKSHNNKEAMELHKYFAEITKHIQGYDSILLFGPGKAQEQFKNYLKDDKHFNETEITVKSGNSQSENEKIAFVRDNFAAEVK